jgi:hypothetical protein
MNILEILNAKKQASLIKKRLIIEEEDVDDDISTQLKKILSIYKNTEFLPIDVIDKMIPIVMSSRVILHEYTNYHKILKITVKDLLSAPITNWQYNRPADLKRCFEIAKYMYNSKNNIDTMIYLSFNNVEQTFNIIDGIHRYTALKIIKEQNSKEIDLLNQSDFGNNNDAKWLFESYIIVNIRFNSLEGDLVELFKSLNKSNPVPDLYIRDVNKYKRNIIEQVVKNFQLKYNSHFSSTNRPQKPNINRDRFIDFLEKVFDKYKISEENPISLENILENLNTQIEFETSQHNTIPQKLKDKCLAGKCWLFIFSVDKLLTII